MKVQTKQKAETSNQNAIHPLSQNIQENANPSLTKPHNIYDSDTLESSHNQKNKADSEEINNSSDFNEDVYNELKKSLGFPSKKIYIEEPEPEIKNYNKRKFSIEGQLFIKDFVPHLKPIEIHLVPSKFHLNKKGFKDLKCNKNNKFLLMNNNYFISCPNSEESESDFINDKEAKEKEDEDDSQSSDSKNNNKDLLKKEDKNNKIEVKIKRESIKDTRKILQRMKSCCIPKILSKNNISSKCKKYEKEIEYDSDNEYDCECKDFKNLFDKDEDKKEEEELYDLNDSSNDYKFLGYKKNNKNEQHNLRGRLRSFSILEVLKRRCYLDEQ